MVPNNIQIDTEIVVDEIFKILKREGKGEKSEKSDFYKDSEEEEAENFLKKKY